MSQHRTSVDGTSQSMPGSGQTPIARRLRRLLAHLKLRPGEFAKQTGLDPSYISRLRSAERGGVNDPSKLILKTAQVFGIRDTYWTSRIDIDPAECHDSSLQSARGTQMGTMLPVQAYSQREMPAGAPDIRHQMADVATLEREPAEMVVAILRIEAPADANFAWWVRKYLELQREHPKANRPER